METNPILMRIDLIIGDKSKFSLEIVPVELFHFYFLYF